MSVTLIRLTDIVLYYSSPLYIVNILNFYFRQLNLDRDIAEFTNQFKNSFPRSFSSFENQLSTAEMTLGRQSEDDNTNLPMTSQG